MSKPKEIPEQAADLAEIPSFELDFDDSIRRLHEKTAQVSIGFPDSPFARVSSLLHALVDSKIRAPAFPLSDLEREWLADLLWHLAYNSVALRALGYKQSKKRPDRDDAIAEDYVWLRSCGVKAAIAADLLVRKWSESESNIKRLIGNRALREAAKLRLERLQDIDPRDRLRYAGARGHRKFQLRSVWGMKYAVRDRVGNISQVAQEAANEIERLTARALD